MNDYLSRAELSPIERASARGSVMPVAPATLVVAQGGGAQSSLEGKPQERHETAEVAPLDEQHLASAAEYAEVHARIANIMAEIRTTLPAVSSTDDVEDAVSSMLPSRVVIVPLPPASKDMVEHAEKVARDIAERAAQSVAAQAHIKPGTVDQMMATVS